MPQQTAKASNQGSHYDMIFFHKQTKKSSDFQTEVIERLDILEHDKARLRQDLKRMFREEIEHAVHYQVLKALSDYQKSGWHRVA